MENYTYKISVTEVSLKGEKSEDVYTLEMK